MYGKGKGKGGMMKKFGKASTASSGSGSDGQRVTDAGVKEARSLAKAIDKKNKLGQ